MQQINLTPLSSFYHFINRQMFFTVFFSLILLLFFPTWEQSTLLHSEPFQHLHVVHLAKNNTSAGGKGTKVVKCCEHKAY